MNDLRTVLSRLYIPVDLNIQPELDVATVEIAMKEVMEAWIDNDIESSSRVRDLLFGRLEKRQGDRDICGEISGFSPLPPSQAAGASDGVD
jgi:hypothetical protein